MSIQSNLPDQAREARNEYAREWRKRNPDKVREANRRYWENRAKKEAEKRRENENAT